MPEAALAQTAEELFLTLPASLSPAWTDTNREELVILHRAGQRASVVNRFGDTCFLARLADDCLRLEEGSSSMEIIVLTMINESKTVCVIHTVCAPVCDSRVEFYTIGWKKLCSAAFLTPVGEAHYRRNGTDICGQDARNALSTLDISLMEFRYDPLNRALLQYYNTPEYLSVADKERAMTWLRGEPVVFRWNQLRFELSASSEQFLQLAQPSP
jgi:hypothetical protein